MSYQEEEIIEEVETQLLLVDTKKLDESIRYDELLKVPRLLKRNYFKIRKSRPLFCMGRLFFIDKPLFQQCAGCRRVLKPL